ERSGEHSIHLPYPCPSAEGRREDDAVGHFLVVQNGSAPGRTPHESDAMPASIVVIDSSARFLVPAHRERRAKPPVEAKGRRRLIPARRLEQRLVDGHVPGSGPRTVLHQPPFRAGQALAAAVTAAAAVP